MKKVLTEFVCELLLGAAVIMLVSYMFEGVYIKDWSVAFLVALILTILNTFVKPILTIVALPITILSLGLFQLVINGFVLSLVTKVLSPDFQIRTFGLTIVVSLCVSVLFSLLGIGTSDD